MVAIGKTVNSYTLCMAFFIYFCQMYPDEIKAYEQLTEGMEFTFAALSMDFLEKCENVIFGEEWGEIRYFCYHFYNDGYLSTVYESLASEMERVYRELPPTYSTIRNNIANLLILLREPKAKENDLAYKNANIKYWRDMVSTTAELQGNGSFKKYVR